MAITWVTPVGGLGIFQERIITEIQIAATSTIGVITFEIIAGALPRGLRLVSNTTHTGNITTGYIKGSPVEVTKLTTCRFVIRATDGVDIIDRTFNIIIDGADTPEWVTPEGYLDAGIAGTHYVLDNSYVSIQLQATDSDITAGGTLTYRLLPNAGEFPPGLTLDSDGLITGFTDPIFATPYTGPTTGGYDTAPWDIIPLDFVKLSSSGYDTYFYDNVTFDYSEVDNTPTRLSRDYVFSVEVSDGFYAETRMFRIYVVTDEYLATLNIGVNRKPIWITKPYLGKYRANNYVTIPLDVYDPPSLQGTITYFLTNTNPDGSLSQLPPGMDYDSMTGDIAGRIPYQARVTKSYKFTMLAVNFPLSVSDSVIVSTSMIATANQIIVADTSALSYQIQLPANPQNGDRLSVVDSKNTFATNHITVESKTNATIEDTNSVILDITGAQVTFVYSASTSNWVLQYIPFGYVGEIATDNVITVNNNHTASNNDFLQLDSSTSTFNVTLPSSPVNGAKISIIDYTGSLELHNVIVIPSTGDTVYDDNALVLDVSGTYITLTYELTSKNWNLQYNPVGYLSDPINIGLFPSPLYDYNVTAIDHVLVRLDSRNYAINVILPRNPSNGFMVGIADVFGNCNEHPITIIPNTPDSVINDSSLVLDVNGAVVILVYSRPTNNWELQFIPSNTGSYGLTSTALTPSVLVNDLNSNVAITSTLVGDWNATTTYNINDAVRFSGFVYICLIRNTNKNPLDTNYWISGVTSEPRTFTVDIIGEIESAISWVTKPNLGTIKPNRPCTIQLEASNLIKGGNVSYKLTSGNLPSGLTLLPSGFIEGKVRQFQDIENNLPGLTRFFDHDSSLVDSTASRSYNMTFDGNTTTFDKKHTFTVVARDSVNLVELPQTFELTVKTDSELVYANLYLKAFMPKDQRLEWHKFITDDSIFKSSDLYRYGDVNFGIQSELKTLLFAGIESSKAETYVQAMSRNHTKKQMLFGDVKIAVALDETTQQPIYEVVYVDLVDQFEKNNTSISKMMELPDNTDSKVLISYENITIDSDIPFVSDSDKQRVFPNSIKNMRKQVETTGTRDRTYLPLWMRSIQPNTNHEPGFTRALVLCYAKPNHGSIIASRIKAKINTASRGNWSPNAYYQVGDTVKYLSFYYTCTLNNSNTKPTDEHSWSRNFDFKLLDFTADRYIIDTLDNKVGDKYLVFPTHREP